MVRKVGDRGVVAVVPPQCPGTGQQAGFSQASQPVTGNMVGFLTFDSPDHNCVSACMLFFGNDKRAPCIMTWAPWGQVRGPCPPATVHPRRAVAIDRHRRSNRPQRDA